MRIAQSLLENPSKILSNGIRVFCLRAAILYYFSYEYEYLLKFSHFKIIFSQNMQRETQS